MAKIILLCGKICSGKSFYTARLLEKQPAVVFNTDELLFAIGLSELGDRHDEVVARLKEYYLRKAEECISCGADVILDYGFWTRAERKEVSERLRNKGIPFEWHYIEIAPERWQANIEKRNALVKEGKADAYFLDEGLMGKLERMFEAPERDEIDVWYKNE